jgi:hypothetical protein
MREGWLLNPKDGWTYRFHRDERSWVQDPMVFVDKGRGMRDGSPALLKSREHLHKDQAEKMWKELVQGGWQRVPAVWGLNAEEP